MKHFSIKHIIVLSFFFSISFSVAPAQDNTTIWIRVADTEFPGDSVILYCVNSPNGTAGIDSLSPCFQEFEYPPGGCCFDARWVSFAPYANASYGGGFIPMDIRGIPTNPALKDTFVIFASNGDQGTENFILQWPDPGYLADRCDSMFLFDRTGQLTDTTGKPIGTIDMFRQHSLTIFEPLQTLPLFKLTIYKYGVHLVDYMNDFCIIEKVEEPNHPPSSFRLEQNYPNPFNPETKISFSIPKSEFVTLKIFDVLGREIATVVSTTENPGTYRIPWNAGRFSSGIYFYELRAGKERDIKKMAILK